MDLVLPLGGIRHSIAVATSPSLVKERPEQESPANVRTRERRGTIATPQLPKLSPRLKSKSNVTLLGNATLLKDKNEYEYGKEPGTRERSYTLLSASASSIDTHNDRRAQFSRDRSYSVPHNFLPKTIDEMWDEVQANWTEYSQKGKWLSNILYKKGIPNNRRGHFWMLLSKIIPKTNLLKCSREEHDGPDHSCLYRKLLEIPHTSHEQQIRADITRTFPTEKSIYAPDFQESLFNVLKAFSLYDPTVGYCQGLSFVAALILMNIGEEQAFWMLIRLLKGHNLRSFYTEDMRGVLMRMYQMNKITQSLFPAMYKHMEDIGVKVGDVTMPWFMTSFGYQLPVEVALRVADALLYEGIPALFRVALSILVLCEKEILQLGVDDVMDYFRADLRAKFTDPQQLMTTAYNVNVSLSQLEKLEVEFLQNEVSDLPRNSEFDQKSEEELSEREHNRRMSTILIDSHELHEKLITKNEEYAALMAQYEAHQKKVEADKIALIERLGKALDLLNESEEENNYLTQTLHESEAELAKYKKECNNLALCNSTLADEMYKLKKMKPEIIKR